MRKVKNTMYDDPTEWFKKPLMVRLNELRIENCMGPCGQSLKVFNKRHCENQTLIEAMSFIANIGKSMESIGFLKGDP